MSINTLRIAVGLVCLLTVLILVPACRGDDYDRANDDDPDDDTADDDTATDDDQDDDLIVDDDDLDDDVVDAPAPAGLLLIGEDDEGWASWRKLPAGWQRESLPAPSLPASEVSLGPTFFLDGRRGWAVWNGFNGLTTGFDLLAYDPATGWTIAATQPSAILPSNLTVLFATGESDLWVISNTIMYLFQSSTSLWHVTGNQAHWEMPSTELGWNSLFFPNSTSGLAAGDYVEAVGALAQWDGVSWSPVSMPVSLRAGLILWMWMTDVDNGWLIWEKPMDFSRRLLRIEAGQWNEVTAPAGCEDTDPWRVVGDTDYAIALDRPTPEDRFWEMRGGSWSCRHLAGVGNNVRQESALVRTDGRAFVLVTDADTELSYLLEVTATEVIRLSVPSNLRAYALHDLGTNAPHYSMSR